MYRLIKFCLFLALLGCGRDTIFVEKEVPVEPPGGTPTQPGTPPPTGTNNPISYVQMQGLLNKNCIKCHAAADFMQSEVALRQSRALQELKTKNMPPNKGGLSDGERTLMVNFF